MKRVMITIALGSFLITSAAGCIFATKKPARSTSSSTAKCKPSHHWDGHKCVHNGKARARASTTTSR